MPDTVSVDDPNAVDRAAEVLQAGGVVILPTDTVYGLAASPSRPGAVEHLFTLKGRDAAVPVAVLCARTDDALALAAPTGPTPARLASKHWPGPLTMVLPRRAGLAWSLGEPAHTIGVRCPDHRFVAALALQTGPIATTSANRHGDPTPPTALAAAEALLGDVDLVVDGGVVAGAASTVVDLTGDEPVILRQGPLVLDVGPG